MRIDGNDTFCGGGNDAWSNATAKAISGGYGAALPGGDGVSEGEPTPDGGWFQPVVDDDVMDCPGGVCPVPWATDKKEDLVNHPSHYTTDGIECIEAIEAQLTLEEYRGYLKGNVAKYVWREKHKGGVQSLQKAIWYLNRLVDLN